MKNVQTHLKYGGLTGLAMVIVGLILHIADLSFKPGMQYVSYIPFVVGILMNAIAYSKANNQNVTFGGVFSSCFKASAIVTIIVIVWVFIAMAIFPEMKEKSMEIAVESMSKRGMSDEEIEQGLEMTQKYYNVFMVGGILFSYMFFGALFSLIGAAIAKKNPKGMPEA